MIDTERRYVTVELSCLYCGHSCDDVRVPGTANPSYRAIRAAYNASGAKAQPEWDAHGEPRCPRCRGKLFIERSERRRAYASA